MSASTIISILLAFFGLLAPYAAYALPSSRLACRKTIGADRIRILKETVLEVDEWLAKHPPPDCQYDEWLLHTEIFRRFLGHYQNITLFEKHVLRWESTYAKEIEVRYLAAFAALRVPPARSGAPYQMGLTWKTAKAKRAAIALSQL